MIYLYQENTMLKPVMQYTSFISVAIENLRLIPENISSKLDSSSKLNKTPIFPQYSNLRTDYEFQKVESSPCLISL